MNIKALRGMKEILPPESEKFTYFLHVASQIAERYGFTYIETPLLEECILFKRSVGESSDIVGKEMYEFVDKGGNEVCLRPEGTAGVVRCFIEHKFDRQNSKQHFFYYGPMFRYERPQRGRFREFHQFGVESFGESSVYEDAAIILLAKDILDYFHIGYSLKINSLGCPTCVPVYKERLVEFLNAQEEICEDCKRRRTANPIRVLDCKNPYCQAIYKEAPKLTNHLCKECERDFLLLQDLLSKEGVAFEVDKHLVRGLDYYTKSAFEFVSSALGAQNAIAGGGRYDLLVEQLGGRPTPAVGFAIGIERILELIELPQKKRQGYYFGVMVEEALPVAFHITQKIRQHHKALFESTPKSLKAHLKAADKAHLRYACIIGEEELENGTIWLKDLENKVEKVIKISEF